MTRGNVPVPARNHLQRRSTFRLPLIPVVFFVVTVAFCTYDILDGATNLLKLHNTIKAPLVQYQSVEPLLDVAEASKSKSQVTSTPKETGESTTGDAGSTENAPTTATDNDDVKTIDPPNTEENERPKKPLNIVLLYGDDWRYDSIGSEGASVVQTPFLDRLAKEGIKFSHSCVTTSVCWISRATLYTGQYVSRHKSTYPQEPKFYDGWNYSFPHLLRENGYYLGHVGKWHFHQAGTVKDTFQYWRSYYGMHWINNGPRKQQRGAPPRIHVTEQNQQHAMEFLKGRPKDQPFFLSVCFFAPHSVDGTDEQYFPQPSSMKLYANDTIEVPMSGTEEAWNRMPYFFTDTNEGRRRWKIRFDNPHKHQEMMKNYYRLISEVDDSSSKCGTSSRVFVVTLRFWMPLLSHTIFGPTRNNLRGA